MERCEPYLQFYEKHSPSIFFTMNLRAFSILSSMTLASMIALPAFSKTADTDSVAIRFHQSSSIIDRNFSQNSGQLDRLLKYAADSDSASLKINSISIEGAASPEGTINYNIGLSHRRANAILDYARNITDFSDSIVSESFTGRDWIGLRELVIADKQVPYHKETLEVIDEIISSESPDHDRINLLKSLHGGLPYRYMYDNLFPKLRYSKIFITFRLPELLTPRDNITIPVVPEVSTIPTIVTFPLPSESGSVSRPFYMALKTNLISDALALPELGVEFYLGKNLSFVGNWTYGWWDNDSAHRYWRAYGGDIALRWWFGSAARNKPLTGHHIGIYGGVLTYDFEFGGTGYMGGKPGGTLWDRVNVVAGVEYGYSLPLARRLNLDFTLGVGYMGGTYYKYIPKNGCYVWQSTHKLRWFGPTKAEISLTWLIGNGNFNQKKGGVSL